MQPVNVPLMVEDEEEAEAEHGHDVGRQGEQEEEEVTVVPAADAVVDPWTVVVKVLQRSEVRGQVQALENVTLGCSLVVSCDGGGP